MAVTLKQNFKRRKWKKKKSKENVEEPLPLKWWVEDEIESLSTKQLHGESSEKEIWSEGMCDEKENDIARAVVNFSFSLLRLHIV